MHQKEGRPRMPRNAKQFVAPSLNLFRVKDSKSTYARTKVPAYLVAEQMQKARTLLELRPTQSASRRR